MLWRVLHRLGLHRDPTLRVLRLAYPVVLGSLSFTLLTVVDTAMLGRLGSVPLAASGVAGVLFFAVVFPLSSVSVGTQTLVSRRFGERRDAECGEVLGSGLALAVAIGIPLVASAPWLSQLIAPFLSDDPEVTKLGTVYVHLRMYGAAFMFMNFVFRGFYAGIAETRQQMISSILITASNIVLDYLLIFGRAGFPRLGIAGAALASTLATGVGTVYFVVVTLMPRYRRYVRGLRFPSIRRWVRPILRLSAPVIGQRVLSHGSWFIFFAVVARIGTLELAATNVIRSIYHLSIMVAIGLGTAASALVGQQLGAGRPDDAEVLAWEAAKLAAYAMTAVGLLFIFAPRWVFLIYTSDPAVLDAGRLSLLILGFVQAFAGVALVLSQALQGAGNTRFVMIAEMIVCLGLYIPIVYFLGLKTRLGLVGAWTAEYAYWGALAGLMTWKFRQGRWKEIVV